MKRTRIPVLKIILCGSRTRTQTLSLTGSCCAASQSTRRWLIEQSKNQIKNSAILRCEIKDRPEICNDSFDHCFAFDFFRFAAQCGAPQAASVPQPASTSSTRICIILRPISRLLKISLCAAHYTFLRGSYTTLLNNCVILLKGQRIILIIPSSSELFPFKC